MMTGGFIKLHRQLLDSPHFKNAHEQMAFAWLLLRAQWQDVDLRYKGKQLSLKRGQLALSYRDFSDKWGWSEPKCRRFIKKLSETKPKSNRQESDAVISAVSDAGVCIITILNYNRFQDKEEKSDAPCDADSEVKVTHDRRTSDAQNKEDNNSKNLNKDNIDKKPKAKRKSSLPDNCPTIEDQKLAIKYWEKKNTACDLTFSIDGFRAKMLSNGDMAVDWSAKWRTWYVNAANWCKQAGNPIGSPYDFGNDDGPLFNQPEIIVEDPHRADWLYAETQFKEKGVLPKRFTNGGLYDCPNDILERNNDFKNKEAAE